MHPPSAATTNGGRRLGGILIRIRAYVCHEEEADERGGRGDGVGRDLQRPAVGHVHEEGAEQRAEGEHKQGQKDARALGEGRTARRLPLLLGVLPLPVWK